MGKPITPGVKLATLAHLVKEMTELDSDVSPDEFITDYSLDSNPLVVASKALVRSREYVPGVVLNKSSDDDWEAGLKLLARYFSGPAESDPSLLIDWMARRTNWSDVGLPTDYARQNAVEAFAEVGADILSGKLTTGDAITREWRQALGVLQENIASSSNDEVLCEATTYYHGTNAAPFDAFDIEKAGSATDAGLLGRGVYFSTDPAIGRNKRTLLKARLKFSRPLRIEMPEWEADKSSLVNDALGTTDLSGRSLTQALLRRGFDAVVLDYSGLGYRHQEVMVPSPQQATVLGENIVCEDDEQRRLRARPNPEQSLWAMHHNAGNGIVPARYMRQVPYAGTKLVTVYRGVRPDKPRKVTPGDWVALSKQYAAQHGGTDSVVISARVSAKDVVWAGTDMEEWFYAPGKPQWESSLDEKRPSGLALGKMRVAARQASRTRAKMAKNKRMDPMHYAMALQGRVRVGSNYYAAGKEAIDAVRALIGAAESPKRKARLRKLLAKVKRLTPSQVRASVRGKRPRRQDVVESRALAERSFSAGDIPKQFFLVGHFNAARMDGLMHANELEGIEGISGDWRIAEKFLDSQGRNMVLVMPGQETARINKLSRVMYDNPHYLAQNDLDAVKRLSGHTNSGGAYFANLLTGHLQSVIRKEHPDFKFEVKPPRGDWLTPWGFWNRQSGIEIQNLNHLTKLWREWGVRQARFPASTDDHKAAAARDYKTWLRWVGQALVNKYGGNFAGEQEWRVKDEKLRVPKGSQLVLIDKGQTWANARLLKQTSGGQWTDDNITMLKNRNAALAHLKRVSP
jgi:hypothetical protein